jgi:hypothetical protein
MRRKGMEREVVVLLVSTLLTAATWVGFEVYRAYIKVEPIQGVEAYLKPLDPTLRTEVLDTLEVRVP